MKNRKTVRILLAALLCCLLFGVFAVSAYAGEPETHVVSFWLEDGVPYGGQEQEIDDGAYAVVPPTPEKENAVFLRWTLEDGERFSFRTPITADLDLYAEWLPLGEGTTLTQIYTVEFQVDGATVSRQSVEAGQNAIAPTGFDTPTGKTFVAWDGDYTNVQGDLMVEAILTDTVYTVVILGPDDTVLDTQEIVHGGAADLSNLPELPHYTIDGEHPYDGVTEGIVSDGEIRVNYLPDVYTVTFYSGGEQFGEAQDVAYGGVATFPEIPAKENYIFIGWYLDPADSSMYDFNLPIENDLDLFAKYIPIENKKYTVTFLNYDGSRYGGVQLIEEGQTAFVPGTPVRDGYVFLGWLDEDGGEFDFATPIESDTTVTALFRVRTFTVTVMDGDEVISEQAVRYGENAEEPEIPEKEGAIFAGFDGSFTDIRQDTVIRVRYITRTFSVMFFDAQQRKIGGTQYVAYGESATAPAAPALAGYAFSGWSEDFSDVREDLVIFPVFTPISYTVCFYDDEQLIGVETVSYGESATGVDAERENYLFIGWRTETGASYDLTTPVTGDLDLFAAWQEKPPVVHTVIFTVDGATYQTQTVADGAAAQNPANPAKYGYTFTGWDSDFSNVTGDMTVAAIFRIKTYTVTFTANGATFDTVEVDHGEMVEAPADAPEREGYRFVGWNYDFETPITEDLTVKAVFAIETYTVRFLVGEEVFATQSVEYGDFATVPGTPQKTGATFVGWYYEDGAPFRFSHSIVGDLNVIAQFETQTYAVTFIAEGEVFWVAEVEHGDTVDVPHGEPDKQGWIFIGWDFDFNTKITRDFTVEAKFEEIVYTVTFKVDGEIWSTATVSEGATVGAPAAPRKDGYRFLGWAWDFRDPVNGNEEIEAEFERITYTVTFTVNGAFWQAYVVGWGETVEEPEEAYADGFVFLGWDFDFETPIKADTVIEAELAPLSYTVTFTVNGETFTTQTVEYGEVASVPTQAPALEGYTFTGWNFDFKTPIYDDTEIEAEFEEIWLTVTFVSDGEVFDTVSVRYGEKVDRPAIDPEKYGCRFIGWDFDFNTKIVRDVTVTARFEDIFWLVTFTVDGEPYETYEVRHGTTIAPPEAEPAKLGYAFIGWDYDFAEPIEGKTVIEAIFEEDPDAFNNFTLIGRDNGDGTTTYQVVVGGVVRTAGFIGKLVFTDATAARYEAIDPAEDTETLSVFVTMNEIRFAYSNAVNATEEFTVLSVTVKTDFGAPALSLSVSELYYVDGSGEIVSGSYTVE